MPINSNHGLGKIKSETQISIIKTTKYNSMQLPRLYNMTMLSLEIIFIKEICKL